MHIRGWVGGKTFRSTSLLVNGGRAYFPVGWTADVTYNLRGILRIEHDLNLKYWREQRRPLYSSYS